MNNLTALIITFLRPGYTKACIDSLRATYPDIKIIVADNGCHEGKFDADMNNYCIEKGAEYHVMPYDSGVCYARNRLVELANTQYVLVGDDDFFYTDLAKVDQMLKFLEKRSEFDVIGGRVAENGVVKNYQGNIDINEDNLIYHKYDLNKQYFTDPYSNLKYNKVDLTFNFFVAWRDVLLKVKWDEEIKVAYEHSDWFISLKKAGYSVAFTPDPVVIHKPTFIKPEISPKYKEFRSRRCDRDIFFKKHNLKFMIDMNGRKATNSDNDLIKRVDFCIVTFKRPHLLERLLISIAENCPNANIYIADQNEEFNVAWYKELWQKLFNLGLQKKPVAYGMGFDKGLSFCRNYLCKVTKNQYKLILDDDFIFNEKTEIDKFVKLLDARPDIGIVGGALTQKGDLVNFEHDLVIEGDVLYHKKREQEYQVFQGLHFKEYDCVLNFALFNKNVFDGTKWDEELKVTEHTDFFLRLKQTRWKVAYLPEVSIEHDKENNEEYEKFRSRGEFMEKMMKKHKLSKIRYINGYTYLMKNGKIIVTRS